MTGCCYKVGQVSQSETVTSKWDVTVHNLYVDAWNLLKVSSLSVWEDFCYNTSV